MKIVVAALIHHKLLSRYKFQRSLVEIEDLFQQLSIEVVYQIELPIPDVIILVSQEETVILYLLLSLISGLGVSLLQISDQLIVVLVQINLVGDHSHSIFNLGRKLADLIEFLKIKSRFAIEVYKLVFFVLQHLFDLISSEVFQWGSTKEIFFCLLCCRYTLCCLLI